MINCALIEAQDAQQGVGIVKLMGREAGFVAMMATLASNDVDICLIPEAPVDLGMLCGYVGVLGPDALDRLACAWGLVVRLMGVVAMRVYGCANSPTFPSLPSLFLPLSLLLARSLAHALARSRARSLWCVYMHVSKATATGPTFRHSAQPLNCFPFARLLSCSVSSFLLCLHERTNARTHARTHARRRAAGPARTLYHRRRRGRRFRAFRECKLGGR